MWNSKCLFLVLCILNLTIFVASVQSHTSSASSTATYNNIEPYKPRYQKAEPQNAVYANTNNPTYSNMATYANLVGK